MVATPNSAPTSAITKRFLQAQDRLVIQSSDLSLETIANMVRDKSINLDPGYQRRSRWDAERQSTLIESFLLNVPVPPIYLSEDDYGKYSAIDGKQRITAIYAFLSDSLRLSNLESFREVNGKRFSELPAELQNALRVRPYVRAVTLLRQTHEDLRYEVFTRLNKQGMPLNAQEIRNVLFRGPLNDQLHRLGENAFLRRCLGIIGKNDTVVTSSAAYQEMQDIEYVLRFLALLDHENGGTPFTGSFRDTMDEFMRNNRSAKAATLKKMSRAFNRAITGCESIWADHAFRRYDPAKRSWRNQFLAGLFEAQMLAVASLDDAQLRRAEQRSETIIKRTSRLFSNKAFEDAVRTGTNTPSKYDLRVRELKSLLLQA